MRRFLLALSLLCGLLVLAGCAAPPTSGQAEDAPADAGAPADPAQAPAPAPAIGQTSPLPGDTGPAEVERSCKVDADCTVKNVGNCCGYYPACVNVDSPTDPAGVQAACAASGMAGVCGFPEISACQCVSGQCQAQSEALAVPLQ